MNGQARRFFSADTESQAVIDAAAHFGLSPSELAYRPVEKKHGFLRRPRVVIEVDPENPRRQTAAPAAPAPAAPAPPVRSAARPGAPQPDEPRVAQSRRGERPTLRDEEGASQAWEGGGELPSAATAEAGAAAAADAVVALAGLSVTSEVREIEGAEGRELRVDLRGPGRDTLVARQGELLRSCEYLLRRMVRELPPAGLSLDSDGFREQREDALRRRAAAAAVEVRRSGEPVLFEPLPAAERRIVHLVIQVEDGVVSESEGEEELRRVRVWDASSQPGPATR